MTTAAIVPIQHLTLAKSRLRERLTPPERRDLVLRLLEHVLTNLDASALVKKAFVVTPDPHVLRVARAWGQIGILQTGVGLNAAIRQGRDEAVSQGAETILIMLGDLPLVTVSDIDLLLGAVSEPSIVLAPDRHRRGTNAMVLRPPNALDPCFGMNSFRAHRIAADKTGLKVHEHRSLGTGFDLDEPVDLDELECFYTRSLHGSPIGDDSRGYMAGFSRRDG